MAFGGSDEVFAWIGTFINMERGQTAKSFRLDRVEHLSRAAGSPEKSFASIHVAGSKGKGSTSTMIASILAEAGLRTGLYVSPHVVDYRERISLAGRPFDERVYAQAGDELRKVVDEVLADPAGLPGGEEPTFFELMTVLFFLCCRRAGCATAAVETGMGGRLDATNIIRPRCSVIMPIELEHVEYLGSTLRAIAGEKAGIIKAATPVVIAAQEAEALDILRSTAASRAAPLRYLPEEVDIQEPTIDHDGSTARLVFRDRTLFAAPLEARLRLVGEIQLKNAAVAAIAVRTAFPDISDRIITEGLAKATLPARFERISDDPPTIIDGAHTVSSAALVADAFSRLYGDGGVLLFGCALGKSAAPMAAILAPRFADVIVTRPGDFKKSDPGKTNEEFSRYTNRARLIEDTDEAVRRAIALARERGVPLLVTGSFYLASIVRAHPALAPILTKKNLA